MPLVRVSVAAGRGPEFRRSLGDAIHRAMVETINVPADDRFQILSEHAPGDLVFDPGYLGIARTAGIAFIQITLNAGRTVAQKKALYERIARYVGAAGVRPEDIVINLVEVPRENWSFGNGQAPYAPTEKP